MMTPALCALLLGLQTQMLPLSPKMFPHPTGDNGAEDYVAAMNDLRANRFAVYIASRPAPHPDGSGATVNNPHAQSATSDEADRLGRMDHLQFYETESNVFRKAIEHLRAGSRKECHFPPEDPAHPFEGLSEAFFLVELSTDLAYLDLSRGNSAAAMDDLANAVTLAYRLGERSYVYDLVGTYCRQSILQCIERNQMRFTPRDAERLAAFATDCLSKKPCFLTAFQRDCEKEGDRILSHLLDIAKGNPQSGNKADGELHRLIKSMTQDQLNALASKIQSRVKEAESLVTQRLESPETNWLPDSDDSTIEASAMLPKDFDQVEALMSHYAMPPMGRRLSEMLRSMESRAQVRLIRLTAHIIQFRWKWNRLPDTLAELKLPTDDLFDPLSRSPFVYERKGDSYYLFSKGWLGHGKVDLNTIPKFKISGGAQP